MDIVSMSILLDIGKLPEGWDIAATEDGRPYFWHALTKPDWGVFVGHGQHGGQEIWIEHLFLPAVEAVWTPSYKRSWKTMNLKLSGGHIAHHLQIIEGHVGRWRVEQKQRRFRAEREAATANLLRSHGWVQSGHGSARWAKQFKVLSPPYVFARESDVNHAVSHTAAGLILYVSYSDGAEPPRFSIQLDGDVPGYPSVMMGMLERAGDLANAARARREGVV